MNPGRQPTRSSGATRNWGIRRCVTQQVSSGWFWRRYWSTYIDCFQHVCGKVSIRTDSNGMSIELHRTCLLISSRTSGPCRRRNSPSTRSGPRHGGMLSRSDGPRTGSCDCGLLRTRRSTSRNSCSATYARIFAVSKKTICGFLWPTRRRLPVYLAYLIHHILSRKVIEVGLGRLQ